MSLRAGSAGTGSLGTGSQGTGSLGTGSLGTGSLGTGSLSTGSVGTGSVGTGSVGTGSLGTGSLGAGATPHAGLVLPRPNRLVARLRRLRARLATHPLAARSALGVLLVGSLALVVVAASGPSALVPGSNAVFPTWEAAPLGGLFGELGHNSTAMSLGLSALLVVIAGAYLVLLGAVRTLSMRLLAVAVLALHLILLMSPPLQLTDLWNYLGYARLGGLHGLNPYTHGIHAEMFDPIYRFATWYHLKSPYGPLFTVLSYPVALLPLASAYWTIKLATIMASLTFIWLVWKCARLLGRDPRFAVAFVAVNPVFLMYAVAGFHNDFFMLIPSTAAAALVLARRERAAGVALMLAVAVKFTAIVLLPFLLIAVRPPARRPRILVGAALTAIPLAAMHYAFFRFTLPNVADQSTLLTPFSVPNVVGTLLGLGGGTPGLLRLATMGVVLTVALLLVRKPGDWLVDAGWSTLALIASLAWLVPWYVIWLLPLAALGASVRLRRFALGFTLYLVIAFIPLTGTLLSDAGINLMGGPAGQASRLLQQKLAQ